MPKESERRFDSELSPKAAHNTEVAVKQGLRYDQKRKFYVDEDGALVRDKFGQPL